MHKDDFFSKNSLKKLIACQNDWCGHGPAGQFWLFESALRDTRTFFAFFKLKFSHVATAKAFSFSANEATHQVI